MITGKEPWDEEALPFEDNPPVPEESHSGDTVQSLLVKVAELDAEYKRQYALTQLPTLEAELDAQKALLKTKVEAMESFAPGLKIQHGGWEVRVDKGSMQVDKDKLQGLALVVPEILSCISIGKPTIKVQAVRGKK